MYNQSKLRIIVKNFKLMALSLGILLFCTSVQAQKAWLTVGKKSFSDGNVFSPNIAMSSPTGKPFVAYTDEANGGNLTVEKLQGGQWVSVGNKGFIDGGTPDLAISKSSGVPYIAYNDYVNGGISVKKFKGNQWITVGTKNFTDSNRGIVSLAVSTSTNSPYVLYHDSGAITLRKFNGTQWVAVGSPRFSDGSVGYSNLSISPSSGRPYVVYEDIANGGGPASGVTTVKKYNGNNWVTVGKEGFSDTTADNQQIDIASSGTPYVAYYEGQYRGPTTVKKYNGNQWIPVGVDSFSDGESYALSLAIKPTSNTPYLAYVNNFQVKLKKYNGNKWINVGDNGDFFSSSEPSLAFIPSSGKPYLAYRDSEDAITVKKYDTCSLPEPSFTLSKDSVTVSFTNQTKESERYYWEFGDGNWDTVQNPVHTYSDSGTYRVCLTAFDECGKDSSCQDVSVNFDNNSSGIKGNSKGRANKFQLYPNPVQNRLRIQSPESGISKYNLQTLTGRIIQSGKLQGQGQQTVDVSDLSAGVYLLQVKTDESVRTKKVVVE